MTILVNPARFRFGADTAIGRLLGDEPAGLAIDFTTGQAIVRDNTAPVTNFIGDANSLLTYTSPSTKWIFNSSGVLVSGTTLRCDHDPVTLTPLGVLMEETRTNVLLRSQDFTTTWAVFGAAGPVTANTHTAPDGTTTADTVAFSGAGGQIYQGPGWAAATYTLSIYARSVSGTKQFRLKITINSVDNFSADFTATTTWQRFTFTIVASTGVNNVACVNGSSGAAGPLVVWGAQLEAGAFSTSYIPSVGSTVTRGADNISLLATSIPVNASAGTIAVEAYPGSTATDYWLAVLSDTTAANRHELYLNASVVGSLSVSASATQANITKGPATVNALLKAAYGFAADNYAFTTNGAVAGTDVAGASMPAVTRLNIGGNWAGSAGYLNGRIRTLRYLPRRAGNAELANMTVL